MKGLINRDLQEAREELDRFLAQPDSVPSIEAAAGLLIDALKNGKKIISCGNGGSLCDATHFAEELTGRYRRNRASLPAIPWPNWQTLLSALRHRPTPTASRKFTERSFTSSSTPSRQDWVLKHKV